MINIAFGTNILLGFVLVLISTLVYFVRVIRPELSRDEDIFFTTLGLIYSCILIIHGWRLDPILLFSQVILVSVCLAASWENVRLRGLVAKGITSNMKFFNDSI